MASAHSYAGPMGLGHSRYATSNQDKALSPGSATSSSSRVASPSAEKETAASHQLTTLDVALTARGPSQRNADAQLALARSSSLKDEVDNHAARVSAVVSTTVENTHRLLQLLRDTCSDKTNAAVDALWKELNDLYAAVHDAKAALPVFLEKQRNSMGLYHAAMLNEMIQDTQDELTMQHKKVSCPFKNTHVQQHTWEPDTHIGQHPTQPDPRAPRSIQGVPGEDGRETRHHGVSAGTRLSSHARKGQPPH